MFWGRNIIPYRTIYKRYDIGDTSLSRARHEIWNNSQFDTLNLIHGAVIGPSGMLCIIWYIQFIRLWFRFSESLTDPLMREWFSIDSLSNWKTERLVLSYNINIDDIWRRLSFVAFYLGVAGQRPGARGQR